MPLDAVPSARPNDCPSTGAREVERLDSRRIGKVHGAGGNPYTAGVVCAKVVRYAERQHHPDRLARPLRRVGPKGEGMASFEAISWEGVLDETAEALTLSEQRTGSEAVWPYCYGGTTGLVQRDGAPIRWPAARRRPDRKHLAERSLRGRLGRQRAGPRRAGSADARRHFPRYGCVAAAGVGRVKTSAPLDAWCARH